MDVPEAMQRPEGHRGAVAPVRGPSGTDPTIVHRFYRQVDTLADRVALRHRTASGWASLTWREYGSTVDDVTAGLAALGVRAGDRVAILAGNRVEWHATDLACLALGAVTVPLYQTSAPTQLLHLLGDSGASVIVVDTEEQLNKVLGIRAQLPELRRLIALDIDADDDRALSWWELREHGRGADRPVRADLLDALDPHAAATIVYTSGTTGPPKGAVLTHGNIVFTAEAVLRVVDVGPDDRFVSFLPLSHIAERIVSHFGQIMGGSQTWFARSLATVAEDIHDCHPTIFFAVPRIWEKLHEAIEQQLSRRHGVEGRAAARYLDVGRRRATQAHARGLLASLEWAALDRVVGHTIRAKLGLDEARVLVSGAAPIDPSLLVWFGAIGLPISEVYGQTEDCGPATLNPPEAIRIGTVGPPIPGVEVRIGADGEVHVRGPSVCAGYWHNPEATAELIDDHGWMRTGDLGRFDEAGYLVITGRKKDLIITAAGQNVAPQPIEIALQAQPLISHAVVVGDRRPYLTALLTLDEQELAAWAEAHHKLLEPEALSRDPDVVATVQAGVDAVNALHARVEGIKRFRILSHELTLAREELTPTMKVRRATVMQRYAGVVEELYAGD